MKENENVWICELLKKILKDEKIIYVDVGARGDIEEPWSFFEKKGFVEVIGFEPEEDEFLRLSNEYPNRKYLQIGLAGHVGEVNLYITKIPAASSIYHPNFNLLKKYSIEREDPRKITKISKVNVETLDLQSGKIKDADFIKLDTQGAELEILKGGGGFLKDKKILGLYVESWLEPIYSDIGLIKQIWEFIEISNFELFDYKGSAHWPYRNNLNIENKIKTKNKIMCFDLTFLLGVTEDLSISKVKKLIAIAIIMNNWTYAVFLAEKYSLNSIVNDIERAVSIMRE